MGSQLIFALVSYAVLWLISFAGAIVRGWGPAESAHDPRSVWLYVRRALLALASLVGVIVVGGADLGSYGWGWSSWLPAVLLLGLLMGRRNRGGFAPTGPAPILLAALHTLATELYFRGYLYGHLSGLIGPWALPLSAVAYGLYYLTVDTVWAAGPRGRAIGAAGFTALGLIFAGCHALTGGILGAWLAHLGAVIKTGGAGPTPPGSGHGAAG